MIINITQEAQLSNQALITELKECYYYENSMLAVYLLTTINHGSNSNTSSADVNAGGI